jgi:hypothetical protein
MSLNWWWRSAQMLMQPRTGEATAQVPLGAVPPQWARFRAFPWLTWWRLALSAKRCCTARAPLPQLLRAGLRLLALVLCLLRA